MNLKKLSYLFFTVLLLGGFASCSSDEDPVVNSIDITLEKNQIELVKDSSTTILIKSGNGGYNVVSDDEGIATVSLENNIITITGVALGQAIVEVTDGLGKKATITVNVNDYDILGTWEYDRTEYDVLTNVDEVTQQVKDSIQGWSGWINSITFHNDGTCDVVIIKNDEESTIQSAYTYENNTVTISELAAHSDIPLTIMMSEQGITIESNSTDIFDASKLEEMGIENAEDVVVEKAIGLDFLKFVE